MKGVDWFLMTSFLFIFLSLVECVLVERLANEKQNEENKEEGIHNEGLVMRFPLFLPIVKLSSFDLERLNSLPP